MQEIALKVQKRETGKQISKRYRREGFVPGIYYAIGDENINILTPPISLREIVYTDKTNVINLEVEGETQQRKCVLKEVTFDPVTDKIVHFDLLGIKPEQKLTVVIPIRLIGQAEGVRAGGILQQSLYKMTVKCLPADLPESIEVDITKLQAGDFIHVGDLNLENLEVMLPLQTVVCSIGKSRASVSRAAAETKVEAETVSEEEEETTEE